VDLFVQSHTVGLIWWSRMRRRLALLSHSAGCGTR
jgi:hypothetical protein